MPTKITPRKLRKTSDIMMALATECMTEVVAAKKAGNNVARDAAQQKFDALRDVQNLVIKKIEALEHPSTPRFRFPRLRIVLDRGNG